MRQVLLMIGTRKGGFLAFSDLARKRWEMTGPIFKGSQVNHVYCAGGAEPRVLAAGQSAWWGPGLQISMDWGQEWTEPIPRIQFADGREKSVERVWAVAGMGNTLYAGVDPAALFRSVDGGITWTELEALTDHPSHKKWMPGAGGMMVHSICVDPANAERVFVGISAAGVFCTEDGGKTWEPRNKNVRADFMPEDQFPEVGQCVHHLEMHPSNPEVLYQQNHCGVYRTEDGGREWIDISEGLPARFGFPIAVHPFDGDTVYVIPEEADTARMTPDGAFRVYRSRNRGDSWEALTKGLPQEHAYQNVLRQAMAVDSVDRPGVYVGTQGGQVLFSPDEGDHWEVLFNWLPPVYSLEAVVIER